LVRRVAFPSTREIVTNSLILGILGVGLSFVIVQHTAVSFIVGAGWGIIAFTLPSFSSDLLLYWTIMKEDPLFYLRRCLALSLFTTTLWIMIFLLCSVITNFDAKFVFPDFAIVLGLFAIIPPRALAIFSMSRTNFAKRVIFTLTEPTLTVLAVVAAFGLSLARMVTGLVLASVVGLTFAFAFIAVVELYGRETIGFSPIQMFKAFLTDWLEARNQELEGYLTELGVEAEVDTTALAFRKNGTTDLKAVVFVSNFHPGPFLNVGSSVLPYLFQTVVNKRFQAMALVPHGVSGHELNLVSQEENEKIIRWTIDGLERAQFNGNASRVSRVSNEIATATSQVFDDCALVTMTASPNDMDDVPTEISNRLVGLTQGKFRHLALVDAHNCLTGPTTMTSQKIGALQEAALSSLQITAEEHRGGFGVGVAKGFVQGCGLREGFGPGGISVLVVETLGQRFAYISVDGNNMTGGLRERIIDRVRALGLNDAEVMTSDTHMVNGIVSAPLGYYPVGEAAPHAEVLDTVTRVCSEALKDLEPCEVGVVSGQIAVTTLGSKSLRRVMSVVYRISKVTALTLFPIVIAITVLTLIFLV
jgi:putative membrane protein